MGWSQGVVVVILMLLLRLAVPVAFTLAIGYALHRLDIRWHPEMTTGI